MHSRNQHSSIVSMSLWSREFLMLINWQTWMPITSKHEGAVMLDIGMGLIACCLVCFCPETNMCPARWAVPLCVMAWIFEAACIGFRYHFLGARQVFYSSPLTFPFIFCKTVCWRSHDQVISCWPLACDSSWFGDIAQVDSSTSTNLEHCRPWISCLQDNVFLQ